MSSLHCWAFAWLNDCANGDEADFTYVQTKKNAKSLMTHKEICFFVLFCFVLCFVLSFFFFFFCNLLTEPI